MKMIVVAMLIVLSGCSNWKPYGDIGIGYQIDSQSDWYVQTDRDWQCENPQFFGEVGVEHKTGWQAGYRHQSWISCGAPFGKGKPELYQDSFIIHKQFGGWLK